MSADWILAAAGFLDGGGSTSFPAAMARLNRETSTLFPNIAASPVPVLLPFDGAALLHDRSELKPFKPVSDYLIGFRSPAFFQAGPAGYDAAFSLSGSLSGYEVP